MVDLTLEEACRAMKGEFVGSSPTRPETLLPAVSTDTRTLNEGETFIALEGPRFDGHQFLGQALQKGARVLVVGRKIDLDLQGQIVIRVEETTQALQRLARAARRRWGGPLLAITGSMGKTSTRQFTSRLLQEKFQTFQSPGNFNNEIGVPLSLLQLSGEDEFAVLELAMNHAGEIRRLGMICEPTHALLTNVAPVHMEFFESIEEIAEAKGEILESLTQDALLFFNRDDERVEKLARRHSGRRISFGFSDRADYRCLNFRPHSLEEGEISIRGPREFSLRTRIALIGRHLAANATAAVAVAGEEGLSPDQIQRGLEDLELAEGRGRISRRRGVLIWDDSYNSNPRAAAALLETIRELKEDLRVVLALGEMLELGEKRDLFHRELGRQAAAVGPALLIAVGPSADAIVDGALHAGLEEERLHPFATSQEAARFVTQNLEAGDLLVIKGSRGIQMERILEEIGGE